jgi:ATP-dependent helicase/nuclease subunit A
VLAQRVIACCSTASVWQEFSAHLHKAAAAGMANRVFDELRRWIALDDAELAAAIHRISDLDPDPACARGRRAAVRALALETPGGGSRCRPSTPSARGSCIRFRFEANVAARFDVLDDAAESAAAERLSSLSVLLERRSIQTLRSAARSPPPSRSPPTARSRRWWPRRSASATSCGPGSIHGDPTWRRAVPPCCRRQLGIRADDTIEQVEHEIVAGPILPTSEWAAVARVCKESTPKDQDQCTRLSAALAADGAQRVETYFEVFFDSKLKPRPNLVTQGLARRHPVLAERLEREQERLIPLRERRRALACRDRTAALITIADAVIARYQRQRTGAGCRL